MQIINLILKHKWTCYPNCWKKKWWSEGGFVSSDTNQAGFQFEQDWRQPVFRKNRRVISTKPTRSTSKMAIVQQMWTYYWNCKSLPLFWLYARCSQRTIIRNSNQRVSWIIKNGTSDARKTWFRVGEYKSKPNVVKRNRNVAPKDVHTDMRNLLNQYHQKESVTLQDIVDFHYHFEAIHPFQDGNGRVGGWLFSKNAWQTTYCLLLLKMRINFSITGFERISNEWKEFHRYMPSAQDDYLKMVEIFTNKWKGD